MTTGRSDESSLGSPFAHHKVQDQRDHREYEQQVDEPSCHMEHSEPANPGYHYHNKYDRPDANCSRLHFSSDDQTP